MKRYRHAFASALFLLSACSREEKSETEAPAPVQVTAVTQDTIRRVVSGDGVFFARDQASVMPKIAAPVLKFNVNRGDRVKQGQVLAVLESRDLAAAAAEAKSALDQAESNFRTTSGAAVPEALVKAQTDVEAARHRGQALELVHALGVARQAQAARSPKARGLARLGLEPLVEIAAVLGQPREVVGRAQLTDQPRRVPRGAAGDVAALEQEHVAPAELRQVIGDAATGDAAADHHHPGVRWEGAGHRANRGGGGKQWDRPWQVQVPLCLQA